MFTFILFYLFRNLFLDLSERNIFVLGSFALQVEGKFKHGQTERGRPSESVGDSDGEFATEKCDHSRRFCLDGSD